MNDIPWLSVPSEASSSGSGPEVSSVSFSFLFTRAVPGGSEAVMFSSCPAGSAGGAWFSCVPVSPVPGTISLPESTLRPSPSAGGIGDWLSLLISNYKAVAVRAAVVTEKLQGDVGAGAAMRV